MFRNELKQHILPFPSEIYVHDWWIAFVAALWGKIQPIEKTLMQYRQHAHNLCGAKLTPQLLEKIPLSERYQRNSLQYLVMHRYCSNLKKNESNQDRQIAWKRISKQLNRYYITYHKRANMLQQSDRSSRLKLLLKPPFGCLTLRKLARDLNIALR